MARKHNTKRPPRGTQFMGWFSTLFSKSPQRHTASSNSTSYHDLDGSPVPLKPAAMDLRGARDLVNQAAVRTAQVYGIPAGWLTFEVMTISDANQAYFQLQVVMNIWDEHLVLHSTAFQNAVIKRIRDENLEVGRALRAVLWRVAPEAGCPYDDMPQAKAWSAEAIKQRGMVRDRINRELYALSTPASGATVSSRQAVRVDAAPSAKPERPVDKFAGLLEDDSFGETRPSTFDGFAATQPFVADVPKSAR
jgi:hypothetical protein